MKQTEFNREIVHQNMLGNEYDQQQTTTFLESQLPGAVADIRWPGEESGANVTISISINGKTVGGSNDPLLKADPGQPDLKPQEELRDPRTGLLVMLPEPTKELAPSASVAIENGQAVGGVSEESMDRLREKPFFPRLPRQVPDIQSGMNDVSGPTWKPGAVAVYADSPMDTLPDNVMPKWREQ